MIETPTEQPGASGVETSSDVFNPPVPEQGTEQQAPQPGVEQQGQAVPAITPEAIQQAVQQGMQAAQPAPQQPQLSEEEINKALNVWNPDEAFATSLVQALTPGEDGNIAPGAVMQVLQTMHNNSRNELRTYARAVTEQLQGQFKEQLTPIQERHQAQERKNMQDSFVASYPALKPYSQLIQTAAAQLHSTGAVFTDKSQMFPALANVMEQMVKNFVPNFALGTPQQTPGQNGGNITPASLLAGGNGGPANGAPNANGKSASIWG